MKSKMGKQEDKQQKQRKLIFVYVIFLWSILVEDLTMFNAWTIQCDQFQLDEAIR